MRCTLLLIRHAVTMWNREGRYQGHADVGLSRAGRAQARRLVGDLRSFRVDAIYSSDLKRAVDTADPLARARGIPLSTDRRLRELDFGRWDGRRAEEIMAEDALAWGEWYTDPVSCSPPGGETAAMLWRRTVEALREIRDRHPGETVAVVTHGGPLRLILAWLSAGRLVPPPEVRLDNSRWVLLTCPEAVTDAQPLEVIR